MVAYNDKQHRRQVLELFDGLPCKALLWEWEYLSSTAALGGEFDPVIVVVGDKVVGFNGVIPVRVYFDGKVQSAIWSCDFIVDPSLRGQGIGKMLKQELKKRYSLIATSGVSEQASRLHFSIMSDYSESIRIYRKIIRPDSFKSRLLYAFQFTSSIVQLWSPLPQLYKLAEEKALPDVKELDALWLVSQPGYQRVVVRDGAYLVWRYQQHPLANYRYITARDDCDQLKGLLVFRVSDDRAYLVDYVGPANDLVLKTNLVRYFVITQENVKSIAATTSDSELARVFAANGFYRTRAVHRFFVAARENRNSADSWFITAGDSDGDLLQAATHHLELKDAGVCEGN